MIFWGVPPHMAKPNPPTLSERVPSRTERFVAQRHNEQPDRKGSSPLAAWLQMYRSGLEMICPYNKQSIFIKEGCDLGRTIAITAHTA